MSIAFEATCVSVEGARESPQVVFTSDTLAASHRLGFTRRSDSLGAGPLVCCESDAFGIVEGAFRVLLTPTRVVVTFDAPEVQTRLNAFELVVGYHVPTEEREAVRRTMKLIFRGTGQYVDDAATGFGLLRAIVIGPPTPTSESLVVPTYLTVAGALIGGSAVGIENPWWWLVSVLGWATVGCLLGLLKRRMFYDLHKYQ